MTFSEMQNELAVAGAIMLRPRRGLAFGRGLAAGIGAVMGALVGRKALMQASVRRGHSIQHRALDPAASVIGSVSNRRSPRTLADASTLVPASEENAPSVSPKETRSRGGTESSNPAPSSSQSVSAVNPESEGEKPRTLAAFCGWLGT
jgi:hypothetical protein